MKRIPLIIIFITFLQGLAFAQDAKLENMEVTLYNPYIPEMSEMKKKNLMPMLNDTIWQKPDVKYDVKSFPFYPEYSITPLKAATLQADPLSKLYKSYVNLGFGTHMTPFAEVSVTNERSKKGSLGLYARHLSSHGKIKMENDEKVFAGYMDNDLSLFGKKFFKKSLLEGSIDYADKTRFAYGYDSKDTSLIDYVSPEKSELKRRFYDVSASATIASITNDSTELIYSAGVDYDIFSFKGVAFQQRAGINAAVGKSFGNDFFLNLDFDFDYYLVNQDKVTPEFSVTVAPSLSKKTSSWNFKFGVDIVYDKDVDYNALTDFWGLYDNTHITSDPRYRFYVYPDLDFGFAIMPSYMNFFINLKGGLDKNLARSVVDDNPYLISPVSSYITAGDLLVDPLYLNYFAHNNTNYSLVGSAGFRGDNGMGGNYLVSLSYSLVEDMLFFKPDNQQPFASKGIGRYFYSLYDEADILNIHGEMDGQITPKLSFDASGNWYNYSLADNLYAPNKANWDASLGLKYNLRNKIIAGVDFTAIGPRTFTSFTKADEVAALPIVTAPTHVNMNLKAEYRYTKILSFWVNANNIGFNKYYEYANYPTQRFLFMVGLTYSL